MEKSAGSGPLRHWCFQPGPAQIGREIRSGYLLNLGNWEVPSEVVRINMGHLFPVSATISGDFGVGSRFMVHAFTGLAWRRHN